MANGTSVRLLTLLRAIAALAQKLLLPLGLKMSRRVAGHKVYFDPGTDIGLHLLSSGRFEKDAIAICAGYIREDGVVIDVGANIGVHTVQFSDLVPHGNVICLEPARSTFAYLLRNIERLGNVIAMNLALSDETGVMTFYVASDDAYSGLKDTGRKRLARQEAVACFRGDQILLPLIGSRRVDLVKIDVEGFEREVIEGMRELVAQHRPVIFCEIFGGVNSNSDPQGTLDAIVALGYDAHVLDGAKLRTATLHDDRYYNYLFIPGA